MGEHQFSLFFYFYIFCFFCYFLFFFRFENIWNRTPMIWNKEIKTSWLRRAHGQDLCVDELELSDSNRPELYKYN